MNDQETASPKAITTAGSSSWSLESTRATAIAPPTSPATASAARARLRPGT